MGNVKEENVINIIADNSLIYIIEKFSDENGERRRLNRQEVRELTRGIFNDNIYEIANFKEERRLLEEIWKTCYDDVRDKYGCSVVKKLGKQMEL
ncbi:hypothetical protein RhiirA4_543144 [Rhizophagus irregularis]|uniref:Uncharacterized protein n=1 Tax=Rhizophagus irregularis TaxID=588596 RepID=A0A2I1GHS7_9GLOM|nr:hypothetical protein RhiirA4_543144 [Rhizophagus irregularis]